MFGGVLEKKERGDGGRGSRGGGLEFKKKEEKWREEKRKMKEEIQGLEMRIQEMEGKLERKIKEGGSLVEGGGGGGKDMDEEMVNKIKEIEKKMELKEREERRNNIVIRSLEEDRGGQKGKREVWEGGGMVVVKLGSREQKREVMEKKKRLKGRKIRIEDDLTWEERKVRWKIRAIAEEERRKGSRKGERKAGGRGDLRNKEKRRGERREDGEKEKWWREKKREEKERGGTTGVSKRGEMRKRRKGEVGEWVVGYWNVAGVKNKEKGFWKEIRVWDVVVMVETWMDGKSWERVERRLPKGYRWEKQLAKRRSKKGRPMGGMLVGVREELTDIMVKEIEEREEGVMVVNKEKKKVQRQKEGTEAKRRGWWDEEYEVKRKEVWKVLRKWRKEGGIGEGHRKLRGEYKLLCKRKKEEENERWLREAQEARTEGEMWQIVNKERKCWKGINEMIKMEEWKGHFMRLLGGWKVG
ncbi:hypothetical protein RF55_15041 [Lasius niger]|uniref:Uncharacterized protein n=1 Tax=Lasius niger TaxID=67767 RepID=A0A0J7K7D6_LASNI|nr:hypothetical protein RF55_15041 [Lasius niger]